MASSILKNLVKFSSSTATTTATRSFSLVTTQISNHTAKWMQMVTSKSKGRGKHAL